MVQLTTVENTLHFLQSEYKTFSNLSLEEQAAVKVENEKKLRHVDNSHKPLRQLIIELCMIDILIQSGANNNPEKQKRHNSQLFQHKRHLIKDIRERERRQEIIVPDLKVCNLFQNVCHGHMTFDRLWIVFLDWCEPKTKEKLNPMKLKKLFTRLRKPHVSKLDFLQSTIQKVQKLFIVKKCRSMPDFHALFTIVECLLLFTHRLDLCP